MTAADGLHSIAQLHRALASKNGMQHNVVQQHTLDLQWTGSQTSEVSSD